MKMPVTNTPAMWVTLIVNAVQCSKCKHFNEYRCPAFPGEDGIPPGILMGTISHKKPYPGDHGIRFEPIEKKQSKKRGDD